MAGAVLLISLLMISCLAASCHGATLSSLQQTLILTASPKTGQDSSPLSDSNDHCNKFWADDSKSVDHKVSVLKAGEDSIDLTWSFNNSAMTDSAYKTVQVKLCYAPISQQDRAWRKTEDNLVKDKTCQHKIVANPYSSSNNNFTWKVQRDVPTGTYFVRVYAYNSVDEEVAYGQTTDAHKTTNLFQVKAISGRLVSLDIASICFSAFAVVTLFGFFLLEKRRTKNSQEK